MMRKEKQFPSTRIKILLFCLIFLSMILFQLGQPPFVRPSPSPKSDSKLVPASLLKWPEGGSPYAVLVDKSKQEVLVYHRDNPFQPFKTYPASTGENDGPKSKMNDRKTPEGIYFFTKSYVDRELAPIYGVRAFPIDYPNPIDTMEGRGGYGIWFHGLDKPLKPTDTNGCVAFDNPNIDDLATYIKLDETPVIISQKIRMVDYEDMKKEAQELQQVIENWAKAWAGKEIDRYMSFYTARFVSGSKNWKQYRAYKSRLARFYKNIEVNIDNLRIVKTDGLVVATFDQDYITERLRSHGKKKLYLQQNSKQWKITREVFTLVKRERITPPKAPLFDPQEIRDLVYAWKAAWENKDLETYMSVYDRNFRSRGMNVKAWRKHRARLNKKYRTIQVDVIDLIIVRGSNNTVKVSFKQDYQADGYHDFGLKKINLVKKGKLWKIKSEEWLPLDKKPLL